MPEELSARPALVAARLNSDVKAKYQQLSVGVAEGLSSGKLVIDTSSIDPIATRHFAARIREIGCDYVDAPV